MTKRSKALKLVDSTVPPSEETWTAPPPLLADLKLAMMTCDRDASAEQAAVLQLERIRAMKPGNEQKLVEVQSRLQAAITAGGYEAVGPLNLDTGIINRRKKQ